MNANVVTKKISISFRLKSAFTLIELLIVVAIIGILAAIAVPNFLSAMSRAKVARVKADIRSLQTAMGAYYVDNNAYPPDHSYFEPRTWQHLTTPVPYINQIIRNPYEAKNVAYPYGWLAIFGYSAEVIVASGGATSNWSPELTSIGLKYWINSAGPDEYSDLQDIGWNNVPLWRGLDSGTDHLDILYNPSNGVISSGDLMASNKRYYE